MAQMAAPPRWAVAVKAGNFADVTIIIPHRNDLEGLTRTLDAIAELDLGMLTVETLVADNRSDCGICEVELVVERHSACGARLIKAPILGAGPARNSAAAEARGRVIAFIDCDCVPSRDWLNKGVSALATAPVAGGPVHVTWEGVVTPPVAFDLLFGFNVERSFEHHQHLLTGNLWVRSEVFSDVGEFHSGISEDIEWCHRAAARGNQLIYVPELVVFHRALADEERLMARWERVTAKLFAYQRNKDWSMLTWVIYCITVAASVLPHGFRVLVDPRINGISLRMQTLLQLCRIRINRAFYGLLLLRHVLSRSSFQP